jgi:mono/diheme cytochrome c family protein
MRRIFAAAVPAIVIACTAGTDGGNAPVGIATSGQTLVVTSHCGDCHTGSAGTLAGGDLPRAGVYPPNLTPDTETGLGSWTTDAITTAVTTGKDDQGATLCSPMPRFAALSAQDQANLVAYLRSLPAVNNQVPGGVCTDK